MILNIFANQPGVYDRGTHYFTCRIEDQAGLDFAALRNDLSKLESASGWALSFLTDDEVREVEDEEFDRIGDSPYDKYADELEKLPVDAMVSDSETFLKTISRHMEKHLWFDDEHEDSFDNYLNGSTSPSETVSEDDKATTSTPVASKPVKRPFKPRAYDTGYVVIKEKVSATISLVRLEYNTFSLCSPDEQANFVPHRVIEKLSKDQVPAYFCEQVPRLVRHVLPDSSPMKKVFWIVRSNAYKNIDFVGNYDKENALDAFYAYVALDQR